MKRWLASTAGALIVALPVAWAERGPSTPEERAKAVTLVRSLESDPLGEKAFESRRWLTEWLIEVPDISVDWCTELLAPILGSKKPHAKDVGIQPLFSAAAFIIENPAKAEDTLAVNVAAVEGALRAYESILRTDPKARLPFLDELIEKRDKSLLPDYVRDAQAKCN